MNAATKGVRGVRENAAYCFVAELQVRVEVVERGVQFRFDAKGKKGGKSSESARKGGCRDAS